MLMEEFKSFLLMRMSIYQTSIKLVTFFKAALLVDGNVLTQKTGFVNQPFSDTSSGCYVCFGVCSAVSLSLSVFS